LPRPLAAGVREVMVTRTPPASSCTKVNPLASNFRMRRMPKTRS